MVWNLFCFAEILVYKNRPNTVIWVIKTQDIVAVNVVGVGDLN